MRFLWKFFVLLPLMVHGLFGQENTDSTHEWHGVYTPKNPSAWHGAASLGFTVTILPRAVAEEEIRQVPLVDCNLRYGLPLDFGIQARLSSVYIANQIAAGLSWSYTSGDYSIALMNTVGYWFGAADFTGFNTFSEGWVNYPGIAVGTNAHQHLITLRAELITVLSQRTTFGEAWVFRPKTQNVGMAFTLAAEYNIWEKHRLLAGLKVNYSQPLYQMQVFRTKISQP